MNKLNTKILYYWISYGVIFLSILIATIVSPSSIKLWGVAITLVYWILLLYLYVQEYNGLKDAVKRRFPDVYSQVFSETTSLKDKIQKIEGWDTNPATSEMLDEDLNITNRVEKINELDFFSKVVFISVALIMIITVIINR